MVRACTRFVVQTCTQLLLVVGFRPREAEIAKEIKMTTGEVKKKQITLFTRVPFGFESVRVEIYKAKMELFFELGRLPTEKEVVETLQITPERYREVLRAAK